MKEVFTKRFLACEWDFSRSACIRQQRRIPRGPSQGRSERFALLRHYRPLQHHRRHRNSSLISITSIGTNDGTVVSRTFQATQVRRNDERVLAQ
jgi:hypothetical protein